MYSEFGCSEDCKDYPRLCLAKDSLADVQVDATLVMLPTLPKPASTARTTMLLRKSARNASYQLDCMTSSLSMSAAPADIQTLALTVQSSQLARFCALQCSPRVCSFKQDPGSLVSDNEAKDTDLARGSGSCRDR